MLAVYPVVLGTGKRFFAEGTAARSFELATRTSEEYIAGAPGEPAADEARRRLPRSSSTIREQGLTSLPQIILMTLVSAMLGA